MEGSLVRQPTSGQRADEAADHDHNPGQEAGFTRGHVESSLEDGR